MTEKTLGQIIDESFANQAGFPSQWDSMDEVLRTRCENAAQTVIEAHEARKWQPIETAPRDGSGFIGWSPTHGIVWNVSWNHAYARFDKNGHDSLMSDYTRWQHMPKPPNGD